LAGHFNDSIDGERNQAFAVGIGTRTAINS
jgi:hypothetical protein